MISDIVVSRTRSKRKILKTLRDAGYDPEEFEFVRVKGKIGVVVYDPDRFYIADYIADVVGGERLGWGPGQSPSWQLT